MLDSDLAELYGVETKVLKRAVRRNSERFPADFMFPLNNQEVMRLRRQNGTSKIFDAIRQLMAPREGQGKKIGFQLKEKRAA